ncbi:precorrin-8X methylmutase [Aureimonas ureilytica]|uniref:precorrin-8X methylmutase n=1 Tax=Aureimonas ureilytica TaxID=401562 RepID=UPI00036C7988|nr:precorrin-8X methylmutase [Aureimonas ureilytica]
MGLDYLRDPAAIYEASFATIRREGAPLLERLPEEARDLAIRVAHSCGMVDAIADLRLSADLVARGHQALQAGAPVLVDAQMVAHGVIARHLPACNAVTCRLSEPDLAPLAARLGTTRSAAQVDLWIERGELAGAVVAIGNAPTALFHLLERLDEGAAPPAAILAFPVGFVGAAESKDELFARPRGVPFATLLGRRGGSAMAAAAVNALAAGLRGGLA